MSGHLCRSKASVKKITRVTTRAAQISSPASSGPDLQTLRALTGVAHMDSIHTPFFMHTSCHPGLIIISIKLDGSELQGGCGSSNLEKLICGCELGVFYAGQVRVGEF